MKKVLVGYVSRTGNTAKMAEFIAEGIRFSGNEVVLAKISDLKSEKGAWTDTTVMCSDARPTTVTWWAA